MPASKIYEQYFQTGNAVRKVVVPEYEEVKKNDKRNNAGVKKSKAALVPFILGIFVMTLIITCRYTIINEKNLESMNLKSDLQKAESILFSTKIAVEQNTDLNKIESYAKQQLGMQKPAKNQIIYVDTSENIGTIEFAESTDFFSNVKSSILNFINNIF